jgi:hypothetical protein
MGNSDQGQGSRTCHVYWPRRTQSAANAQLSSPVVAPALDPAAGRNDARVGPTQGNDIAAWWEEERGRWGVMWCVVRGGLDERVSIVHISGKLASLRSPWQRAK